MSLDTAKLEREIRSSGLLPSSICFDRLENLNEGVEMKIDENREGNPKQRPDGDNDHDNQANNGGEGTADCSCERFEDCLAISIDDEADHEQHRKRKQDKGGNSKSAAKSLTRDLGYLFRTVGRNVEGGIHAAMRAIDDGPSIVIVEGKVAAAVVTVAFTQHKSPED